MWSGGENGEEYYEEFIYEPEDDRTLVRKVYDEVKNPLLVFSLFFLLSLRFLDRQIALYMPSCVNDYRRLNILGILLKSVVAGLLFFVLHKFVLTKF